MLALPTTPREWLDWYDRVRQSIARADSLEQTLDAVVRAAVVTVPGATWSSITRGLGEQYATVASTGDPAVDADRLQYTLGEGPCLAAAGQQSVFDSGDLAADTRWPRFGPRAAQECGTRSVLSVRMVDDSTENNTGLNVYSDRVHAFTEESMLLATMLATHAGALITMAQRSDQARHLQSALESNREIGMAMGVLMSTYKLSREDAFDLLRIASQNTNRKLRDIASEVADTGTLVLPDLQHRGARGTRNPS